MPIYEYKCKNCNEEFEALVFKSDETVPCPKCNGEDVDRLMSACGFKSRGADGGYTASSAGSSSCAGCTSTNCSSCH